MSFLMGIWHGLGQIWAHKLRSFLSLLSVFLGVASLIVIIGFINGLFANWEVEMLEFGGIDTVNVTESGLPEKQRYLQPLSTGLTLDDAFTIADLGHNLKAVAPTMNIPSSDLQAHGKRFTIQTQGVTPGAFITGNYEVVDGRILTDRDVRRQDTVVVISEPVRKALFGKKDSPVGQSLTIDGVDFTVVGLLKNYTRLDEGYDFLERKNRVVFIPITTCRNRFMGVDKLSQFEIKVDDVDKLHETVLELNNILTHAHRGLKDFRIDTRQEMFQSYTNMKTGFYLTGISIGVVTLLIGGVGIMNLMLASINERMREIGLRKAIGARSSDIFVQVLAEAISLCSLGGVIGIALGWGIIPILQSVLAGSEFSPVFSWSAGLVGFAFSCLVGALAGVYPAVQAARLDPIEALRYE